MYDEMMIEQNRIFLLSRIWKFPTIVATIFFVLINVIMIYDHMNNENPICNASRYANWIYDMIVYEGISFNVMIIMQLSHVILWSPQHIDVGCQIICCFIFIFAGASSFIDSRKSLIGICEDAFGVRLPASLLAEWIVCVPLMYYIVLSTDQKQTLSQNDFLILSFTSVVYLSCFGLQVVNFQPLSVFLLITAFFAFFVSSYLFYYATVVKNNDFRIQAHSESELTSAYTRCVKNSQKKIALIILSIFPFFPLVYLLSLFRVINHDMTYLLIIILNVISKIVFVNIVINTNANINIEIIRIQLMSQSMALNQEAAANESRRQFVRYIMHEVRVPLNSITMGIGYLEQCPDLDDEAQDALIMMNGATGFMKQTLNDVLNMQRIEDGKMELEYAPFSIDKMIQRVRSSVQGIVREKQISLVLSISNNVPQSVIGDGFRVEHVIVNLLSNALKFSPPDSEVVIEVKCGVDSERHDVSNKLGAFNNGTMRRSYNIQSQASPIQSHQNKSMFSETTKRASITFSVTDHGPGMAESDLQTLFLPFSQIRPHELQSGGGSGIGLVICKQIVELHGGSITCTSEVGVGSTFSFTIPFEIGVHSKNNKVVSGRRSDGVESESEYKKQEKYRTSSTLIDSQLENVLFSDKFTCEELTPYTDTDNHINSRTNLLRGVGKSNNSPSVSQHPVDRKEDTSHRDLTNNSMSTNSPLVKHALLVDDVTSNRKLLAMLLKKRGILSSMASNGQLALETVSNSISSSGRSAITFDIIFMDNSMPIMSGVEATRQLRAMGFGNLIIGITGNAMEDDVDAFIGAGADSVILKPVSVHQINQLVTYIQIYGNSHVEGRRISFYDTHYLATDTTIII